MLRLNGYQIARAVVIIGFSIALIACGGGGGGGGNNPQNVNTGPVADAGADQKAELNSVIILNGNSSSDADGDPLTYSWTLISSPAGSAATLTDADTDSPTLSPDIGGLYVVGLIVNDGTVDSSSDTVTVTAGILFPDYQPIGTFTNCTATYLWTVGPNSGQQFSIVASGSETVNYVSGALTGTFVNGGFKIVDAAIYNDGNSFKILRVNDGTDNVYLTNDCSMTAHPDGWSFDIIYDGMLFDRGSFFLVDVNDPTICTGPMETGHVLFAIQDVTIQGTLYQDAIIEWTLETNQTFTPVSSAKLTSLGIIPPTSSQTGGLAVTEIEVYAVGIGLVANGDVFAQSGTLNYFAEFMTGLCN